MSKEILAEEFMRLMSEESDGVIEISDKIITDRVLIKDDFPRNGLILKNCEFKEFLYLLELNLVIGVKFIDCKFNQSLSFKRCSANGYDALFNRLGNHIDISSSYIKDLAFHGECNISRGIMIHENTYLGSLFIRDMSSNIGGLTLDDVSVEEKFDISQSNFSDGIFITNKTTVKSRIRFVNIKSSSIVFQRSFFEEAVWLWSGIETSLCFEDSEFYKDVNIKAVPISSLTIVGSDFKESFKIKIEDKTNNVTGSLDKLFISSSKFRNKFLLDGDNIDISKFQIDFSRLFEGACCLKSCNILETIITGDNHGGNLVFNLCKLKNLKIDNFNNYSNLSLLSVKAYDNDSLFSICNTNLGKTQLFNTSLDNFKQIIISNSILLDLLTANVIWFADEQLFTGNNNEREYVQIREVYRQLKYSSEKEGNIISSLRFKALELQAYRKELYSKYSFFSRLFRNDTYLMWAGMTNNNWQCWFKPVILAIFSGAFLHFLMIVGISEELEYSFNMSSYSWSVTCSEYYKYFNTLPQVMNPTHILSRVFGVGKVLSTPVYLFDYFLRIVITFFIFQVVTAFRRYMK